ncbi:flagellin [Hydrogenivirga caldilitoris]|uniref:Flagellin n=1 Tax=Hydrogenivirga caldilitoris TaxID=246264 RepID=A0A497XLM0_9AQUI|nr:flagellin [Hydrogenivirga caldilitoris]RLJ69766.1 flagellin [Hydrogenivirga caldilitoris]
MALRINFNYEAAVTHTALKQNERLMNKSLLRLSTGLRILNAADDSAGLFIADQLAVVSAGLEQGNRNIQTGISALQIAENSSGQIYNKLKEIYVKAENAANDINDPNARAALQKEISNLVDAIQKIGTDTEYNGIKLLDGTFAGKSIHYGPRYGQTVTVNIGDVRAQSLGAYIVSGNGGVYTSAADKPITGLETDKDDYALANGEELRVGGQVVLQGTATTVLVDAATAANNINNDATLQAAGIEAVAKNKSTGADFTGVVSGDAGDTVTLHFYVGARDITSPNFSITGVTTTTTLSDLVTQINSQASATGTPITARAENGKLVLETTNGETIAIEAEVTADAGSNNNVAVNFSQLIEGASDVTGLADTQKAYAVKVGELQIYGTDSFVVNESGIDIVGGSGPDTSITATLNNLYSIDVSTNSGAETALLIIKKAIQKVDTVRSEIGAVMNNLQTIFDAQKVAQDNTNEAENVIRNVDFAEEMKNFTTMQIRMQSGVAMLAQANTLPQLVLQLLR